MLSPEFPEFRIYYLITKTRSWGGWIHSIPRSVISAFSSTQAGSILYSKADLEKQNFSGLFFKMWYNIANQLRPVLFLAG